MLQPVTFPSGEPSMRIAQPIDFQKLNAQDGMGNLPRPPKTGWRMRSSESVEVAHRQFASGGPESAATIQRRKSSEQVPRMAKRKARILNREICEPREPSFAGLRRAGHSSTRRATEGRPLLHSAERWENSDPVGNRSAFRAGCKWCIAKNHQKSTLNS